MFHRARAVVSVDAFAVLLLSLLLAVGSSPSRAGTPTFTDVTADAGLSTEYSAPGTYGPGVAAVDYDNDGDLDLFMSNDRIGNQLFRNNGDGTFTDVAPALGLNFISELPPVEDRTNPFEPDPTGMMPQFIDTDNDGDRDFFVSCWNAYCRFFENNGDGTFTDKTHESGLSIVGRSATTAFADYDRDGDLDVYIVDWGGKDHIFLNGGNNVWSDQSQPSRIYEGVDPYSPGWCAVWYYQDDDLWPDLYVGNDYGFINFLYINQTGGQFLESARLHFPELNDPDWTYWDGNATMGQALGDYDHDGDYDLFVANSKTNDFYRRDGTVYLNLIKEADQVGPGGPMSQMKDNNIGWFCDFPDVDNDGWVDVLLINGYIQLCFYDDPFNPDCESMGSPDQPNQLWQNNGGAFSKVTESSGFVDTGWSKSAAVADFDHDGDLDIFVTNSGSPTYPGAPRYFRNDTPDSGHFLVVKLRGVQSNREGIGAQLRATAGGYTHMRDHWHSSGYLSQRNDEIHFGLGAATVIDELKITWPSGVVDIWNDVAVDQRLTLEEGSSTNVPVLPLPELEVVPSSDGVRLRWTVDPTVAWEGFAIYRGGPGIAAGRLAEHEAVQGQREYEMLDARVEPGVLYQYRVEASMAGMAVESQPASIELPRRVDGLLMAPAYPNPFNPRTTLRFHLPQEGPTRLRIVDALGRVVTTLEVSGQEGWQEIVWNGTDAAGREVASGSYRALIEAGGRMASTSLVLVR